MVMDQARIGRFLQELRKEKGLTQEQLAENLYVARRTVSRWETGSNMPDLDVLVQLADLYDVNLRELLDGERKDEEMDKETKDTVLKVAEYSNAKQQHITRVVLVFFVLGIVALAVNLAMDVLEIGGTSATEFVKGMTYGIALGVMIMGVLYTTGLMSKFQAFKLRLIGRE